MHLLMLVRTKAVVICGDFNVSLNDDDIYEGSSWQEVGKCGRLPVGRERQSYQDT